MSLTPGRVNQLTLSQLNRGGSGPRSQLPAHHRPAYVDGGVLPLFSAWRTPSPRGVTGFLKVGDWFFWDPPPPPGGRLAEWVRHRRRQQHFELFSRFADKMSQFWEEWLVTDPPGGVVKVGDWCFGSK